MEPGGFSTDRSGPSAVRSVEARAYDGMREARAARFAANPAGPGDPAATGPAILELVDAPEPPLRAFFGTGPLEMIRPEYASRLAIWEQWDGLARRAHGGQ